LICGEKNAQSFFPAMTKIVGTLGPKSRSVDTISSCLKAGMSGNQSACFAISCSIELFLTFLCWCWCCVVRIAVARFDFSWGDAEYHQETLENLKVAIKSTKNLCAVSPPPHRLQIYCNSIRFDSFTVMVS
jgi:pyruvate kinase